MDKTQKSKELNEFNKFFSSKKYLAQYFKEKKLMISSEKNDIVLTKIDKYLIVELKNILNKLKNTADTSKKTILTQELAEESLKVTYEVLSNLNLNPRLFSDKFIINEIHLENKMISSKDKIKEIIKALLLKKLLYLVEKTSQTCKTMKKVIITEEILDIALEMAEKQ